MDHSSLKDLVEFMAKALVDEPDQVEVNEVVGEQTTVVELKVAKEDLGKVIGKQGRTARSMRTILNAASTKLNARSSPIATAWRRNRLPSSYSNHTDGRPAASLSFGPSWTGPLFIPCAASRMRRAHAYLAALPASSRHAGGHEQNNSRLNASPVSTIWPGGSDRIIQSSRPG